eukprot:TRINITY_DN11223_c0_g1_i1.p1 TRINITY_DN11223_c0_g1~~TRINITY_DN11223_c0_g1_i1.p1  ORF type:complete len:132 (+),score=25.76 TRINITY_DN11223_c0_g1_i1:511-906(+)
MTARRSINLVPDHYVTKREKRDGNEFHITIINRGELESLGWGQNLDDYVFMKNIMTSVSEIPDNWTDEGVGSAAVAGQEAYFKVILWPAANQFRKSLGLPVADFHITVGFKEHDLFGVDKSINSLLKKRDH